MDWERDGTWVIEQWEVGRVHLSLAFGDRPLTLGDIVALRRLVPEFSSSAPAALRALLRDDGTIDLGEHGPIDGGALKRALAEAGLPVVAANRSYVRSAIMREAPGGGGKSMTILEDDAEHERTVAEMIAAGVPVRCLTCD